MKATPLSGQVVCVTGAARGIGEATARVLHRRGARLLLVGLEPERLQTLAAELGPDTLAVAADVTDQAALEAAVQAGLARFGRLDAVVVNAGVASNSVVRAGQIDALIRTIDVNLSGAVRTVSACLPHLVESRGYVLLIASASAITTLPGLSTYAAAKLGLEHFGRALRLEVHHLGVSVGVALPGWIDTDLVRDARAELSTFDRVVARLPGPFGAVTPVEKCAKALVDAVERRARSVYVPRSLVFFAALRTLMWSPLGERYMLRIAARAVPKLEAEARAAGHAFGKHSVERR